MPGGAFATGCRLTWCYPQAERQEGPARLQKGASRVRHGCLMSIMTSANSLSRRSELALQLVGVSLSVYQKCPRTSDPGRKGRGVPFQGAAPLLGAARTEGRPA